MVSAGLALAACGGADEVIPIDAAIAFDGAPPIDAVVIDAPVVVDAAIDAPPATSSCVWSVTALTLVEGATATATVHLAEQPVGNATAILSVDLATVVAASPIAIVYNPSNYNLPATITLTAPTDADAVSNTATVTCTVSGGTPAPLAITVTEP